MRALLAALLVSVTMVSDAQVAQRDSEVVAATLYTGCIKADLLSADITPTRVGIIEYVEYVDDRCLGWTLIWLPALLDGEDMTAWPDWKLRSFNTGRMQFLQALTESIRAEALR